MRNSRFWIPIIIGFVITPLALIAVVISSDNGRGSFATMYVLYPVSILIPVFSAEVTQDAFAELVIYTISMVLVFGLQFPFYGFVLSYARLKKLCLLTTGAGVICLHLFGIAGWLIVAGMVSIVSGSWRF